MWSDTVMLLERGHLVRLLAWGAISAVLGATLMLSLGTQRRPVTLLSHFSLHTAAWGLAIMAFAIVWWRLLTPRDIEGFARLQRQIWASTALAGGLVIVGATMATTGWVMNRRLSFLGAGAAIAVQGLALATLSGIAMTQLRAT